MTKAPRRKVLVVDDERTLRLALTMALTNAGLTVVAAETGEEALDLWPGGSFDLLITDKNLPGISGVDLLRELRRRGDDTPALLITAYASIDSALETMNLGVHALIEKPFPDIFAVVKTVEAAIAEGRSHSGRSLVKASQHFGKAREVLDSVNAALGRLRILIANPNPQECAWLAERLERDGDEIIIVDSNAAARREIAAGPRDLLVVDKGDDEADLEALLAEVRQSRPTTVLVVTGTGLTLCAIIRLIDVGVRAVVEKPLTEATFHERVSGLVEALRTRGA